MPVLEHSKKSSARFNFRLPADIKERIESAALVSGLTVTDFAINSLADSADSVLEKHESRILTNRDRDVFLAMLENPPKPNKALLEAVREYRRWVKK